MRHLINIGLLFTFAALAITGVLAFVMPFSITNTRVHIVAGSITLLLVVGHLAGRIPYFRRQFARETANLSRGRLAALILVWGGILATAVLALPPGTWLMDQGYEARHRSEIVRASSLVGFSEPDAHSRLVVRRAEGTNRMHLSLHLGFRRHLERLPAFAVWAETTAGALIETLHLPSELTHADRVEWHGMLTRRNHLLPIWRNRYTAVAGIDGDGKVDAVTGATDTHRFALEPYLVPGTAQKFVVCVEVNAVSDPNEAYPDPELGQPSLLYTAYVKLDAGKRHHILELTAHGGGAEQNGNLQYDLEAFTTARKLVDLLLLKIEDEDGSVVPP
jgi:hypothetical protein